MLAHRDRIKVFECEQHDETRGRSSAPLWSSRLLIAPVERNIIIGFRFAVRLMPPSAIASIDTAAGCARKSLIEGSILRQRNALKANFCRRIVWRRYSKSFEQAFKPENPRAARASEAFCKALLDGVKIAGGDIIEELASGSTEAFGGNQYVAIVTDVSALSTILKKGDKISLVEQVLVCRIGRTG